MVKNVFYFSHDSNARNDEKILMLRAEHGMEGYGVYWALVEMMFECEESKLSHNRIKGLAVCLNIPSDKLKQMLNTCLEEQLFCSDGEYFWSDSLLRRKQKLLDLKEKRAIAGSKGGIQRVANLAKESEEQAKTKQMLEDDEANAKQMLELTQAKSSKLNKIKENKIKDNKNTIALDSAFEEFYSMYPRKRDRKRAQEKFNAAAKIHGADVILQGTKNYLKECELKGTELKYIKHPATFLNQESFLNEFDLNPRGERYGKDRDAEQFAAENEIPF